jgi:outer membrane protein insertion porin family/translocation and assembly module TamA
MARLDLEHASALTASDYRYNRVFFDGAVYSRRRRADHVLSAHLRAGWVGALTSGTDNGVLHPRKRFYAGGASSVRGYGENELGPRILTIDGGTLLGGATNTGGGACALTVDAVKFCDPNSPKLSRNNFIPQPLGGGTLLEGSVEYRGPLPFGETFREFTGALFVDGAIVGRGDIRGIQPIGNSVKGTGAITPGFGIRYKSPVGPIRMDIGINPNHAEDLAVVTAVRDATGQTHIVALGQTRNFSQAGRFIDRLAFHFSIGEAY